MDANGKAVKTAATFQMQCAVRINVRAAPNAIWGLLMRTNDYPRWNSTIESLEGDIAVGNKLALRVVVAPGRVFRPKVTELVPERRMVWSDGAAPMFKGVRVYELSPQPDGSTDFSMVETFRGAMLPLIKGSLPDFGPPFEQYAADLKRAAETVPQSS